jgi:hypothetical protein
MRQKFYFLFMIKAITIYILTKELGDTLQVLYATIHTQSIRNPLNSVLFTVDETVLARSRLSGLSVAMQERDEELVASTRSLNEFDITAFLRKEAGDLFTAFGGHKLAGPAG